ncbi:ParB-like nuclease family protein [Neorhizobium sp. JUb45]|nr:ParB-like nuclease family protein [Neorhizobium sp. JUb45]
MLEETRGRQKDNPSEPDSLPASEIEVLPTVFQSRGDKPDEYHVNELISALKRESALDPVSVWRCGGHTLLVDGHHRHTAYTALGAATGKELEVPVKWVQGPLDKALWAAADSTKAKLAMTPGQRLNRAWVLVTLGRFPKATEASMAGVSTSQIATMRKVKLTLGESVEDYRGWKDALRAYQGRTAGEFNEDDRQAWLEQQADEWAARMRKTFGTKLSQNTELAAMVMARYFGRNASKLAMDLADELGMEVAHPEQEEMDEEGYDTTPF